ncbi:unnamed protein product, partial [Staurois parvus]
LKLCEEWPVDETRKGRDLGAFLRQRVTQAFREGETTQIQDPEVCDQMYESLNRINSNYYKEKVSHYLASFCSLGSGGSHLHLQSGLFHVWQYYQVARGS